jgi:hypothetical protein
LGKKFLLRELANLARRAVNRKLSHLCSFAEHVPNLLFCHRNHDGRRFTFPTTVNFQ